MKTLKIILWTFAAWAILIACGEATPESSFPAPQNKIIPVLQQDTIFSFETYESGKSPIHWTQYYTGRGEYTEWKIVEDAGNNVLAQWSQDQPNYHFNEIVWDEFVLQDVDMQVRLKGVKGKKDQGGGLVWRFLDANNYYVVRANPLENNVVLYKVQDGIRSDLPVLGKGKTYGVDVPELGSGWNTLRVQVKDDLFTVYLNDKEIFQVRDKTFRKAGKTGLWTKADAVTYFDDFSIKPAK